MPMPGFTRTSSMGTGRTMTDRPCATATALVATRQRRTASLTIIPAVDAAGSARPRRTPGARLGGLDLAVARRSPGDERVEEMTGGVRDLVDGAGEGDLVGPRGPGEAAQLADELERGGPDLVIRGRRREVVQRLDGATHGDASLRSRCDPRKFSASRRRGATRRAVGRRRGAEEARRR